MKKYLALIVMILAAIQTLHSQPRYGTKTRYANEVKFFISGFNGFDNWNTLLPDSLQRIAPTAFDLRYRYSNDSALIALGLNSDMMNLYEELDSLGNLDPSSAPDSVIFANNSDSVEAHTDVYFMRSANLEDMIQNSDIIRFECERHPVHSNALEYPGFQQHTGLTGHNVYDTSATNPPWLIGTADTNDLQVNALKLVIDTDRAGIFADSYFYSRFLLGSPSDYDAIWWRPCNRKMILRFRVRIDSSPSDTLYSLFQAHDTLFTISIIQDTNSVGSTFTRLETPVLANTSSFPHRGIGYDTIDVHWSSIKNPRETKLQLNWSGKCSMTFDYMEALTDTFSFPPDSAERDSLSIVYDWNRPYPQYRSYAGLTAHKDSILKHVARMYVDKYDGLVQYFEMPEERPLATQTIIKRFAKLVRDYSNEHIECAMSMHDSVSQNFLDQTGKNIPVNFYGLGLPMQYTYYLEGVTRGWLPDSLYADPRIFAVGAGVNNYGNPMVIRKPPTDGGSVADWEARNLWTGGRSGVYHDSSGHDARYTRPRYRDSMQNQLLMQVYGLRTAKATCLRTSEPSYRHKFFVFWELGGLPLIQEDSVGEFLAGSLRPSSGPELKVAAHLSTSCGASGLMLYGPYSKYVNCFDTNSAGSPNNYQGIDGGIMRARDGWHGSNYDTIRLFNHGHGSTYLDTIWMAWSEDYDTMYRLLPIIKTYGVALADCRYVKDYLAREFYSSAPDPALPFDLRSVRAVDDSGHVDSSSASLDSNRTLVHISMWIDTVSSKKDTLLYITNTRTDDSYDSVIRSGATHGDSVGMPGTFDSRYIKMQMKAPHFITDVADTVHSVLGKVRTPYVLAGDSLVVHLLPGDGVLVRLQDDTTMKSMIVALNYSKPGKTDSIYYQHGHIQFDRPLEGVESKSNDTFWRVPSATWHYSVGIPDTSTVSMRQDSLLYQHFDTNRVEKYRHQNWTQSGAISPTFKFKKTLASSHTRPAQIGFDSIAHPVTISMEIEGLSLNSYDSIGIYDPFFVNATTFQNVLDTARRNVPFAPAYGIPATAPSGTLLGADPQAYGGVFLRQQGISGFNPFIPNYALRAYQTHKWPFTGHWLDTIPYFGDYSFLEWHYGDVNNPDEIIKDRAFPVSFYDDYDRYTALYKQHNFALVSPVTPDTGYSYNNQRKLWFLGRDDSNQAWYRNVFSSYGRIYTAKGWHQGASGGLNGWMNWLPEQLVTEWGDTSACYPALAVHIDSLDQDTSVSYVYQQNDVHGVAHVYRTTIIDGVRYQEMVSDSLGDHLQQEATPVIAPLNVYIGGLPDAEWDILAYAIEPTGTQNGAIAVRVIKRFDPLSTTLKSQRLYFGGDSAHWPTIWACDSQWFSLYGRVGGGVVGYNDFPVYLAWQDTTPPIMRPAYLPNQYRYDDIYARCLHVLFDNAGSLPLFDTTSGEQNVSLLAEPMSYDNRRPCISGIRSGKDDTMTVMIAYETNKDPNMIPSKPKANEGVGVAYMRPPVVTSWQKSVYFAASACDPFTPHGAGDTLLFLKPSISVTRYTNPSMWWLPTVYYYSLAFEARNNTDINLWHFALDNSTQRDTFGWYQNLRNPQVSVGIQSHDSDMEREALSHNSGNTRWMIHQNYLLFKLPDIDHDFLYDYRSATLFDTMTNLLVCQGIGEFQTDDYLDQNWVDVVRREDNELMDTAHGPDYFLQTDDFWLPSHGTLTYTPWLYTSSDSMYSNSHEKLVFRLDFYDSTDQFLRTLDSIWICDTQSRIELRARQLTFNGGSDQYGHVKFSCSNPSFRNCGSVQKIISAKRMSAFKESSHFAKNSADSLQLKILQNPAKNYADISFILPGSSALTLQILDVGGRQICDMATGQVFRSGEHTLRWTPAAEVPSGIYTVVLRFAGMMSSTQIAYVK